MAKISNDLIDQLIKIRITDNKLEQLVSKIYRYTVYGIKHKHTKRIYIGYYLDHDVQDIYWHYVHDTKQNTVGWYARKFGTKGLEFFPIARLSDRHEVRLMIKLYIAFFKSKGWKPFKL
jgi:hypothetical protein